MDAIRPARPDDLGRIAEIEVFCYRLNFYPIFRDDDFYFGEYQVLNRMAEYRTCLDQLWVYDDGNVKGFVQIEGNQLTKLFVEPVLQGGGIGAKLFQFALEQGADYLWALEKNERAIAFYQRHGFRLTEERKLEEGTEEYLIKLVRMD